MGFVARTIFWLGLVYSAMPLDFSTLVSDKPPSPADIAPCANGLSENCRRGIDGLRKTLDAAAALGLVDRVVTGATTTVVNEASPPRKPSQSHLN